MMKKLYQVSRLLLGMTFIFSGFVKGQDPLGTMFKIEDYLIAYGWDWALPFALALSILLCTAEFVIGAGLILNYQTKLIQWLILLFMVFFTCITFYDALYNAVSDCGCFGDAIKLTNWQTFFKNIVLLALVAILFYTSRNAKPPFFRRTALFIAVTCIFAGFSIWSFYHLPLIDFLPWKKGNIVSTVSQQSSEYYVTYRNKTTGEEREFPSNDFPYKDSIWMSQWEFVSSRVVSHPSSDNTLLLISDTLGNDVSLYYLNYPDFLFIATIYDLHSAPDKSLKKLSDFIRSAENSGYTCIILTSALNKEIEDFALKYDIQAEIFNIDDIALKMMVRANPGLILIKNGVIIDKWNVRSMPDFNKIEKKHLKLTNE